MREKAKLAIQNRPGEDEEMINEDCSQDEKVVQMEQVKQVDELLDTLEDINYKWNVEYRGLDREKIEKEDGRSWKYVFAERKKDMGC